MIERLKRNNEGLNSTLGLRHVVAKYW